MRSERDVRARRPQAPPLKPRSARQAAAGGESILVDGQYLVDAIARDPARGELARFLWFVPVEQCLPAGGEVSGVPVSVRSLRPVASRTAGGRVTVRYNETQRLEDGAPADPAAAGLLAEWDRIVRAEAAAAPRFALAPGELLCIDNYRIFHGREPYEGADRLFQRMQAFSTMSFRSHPELRRT
ncbi:MAG TPA: TauD/TfdA family dioxygenase [Trebonia sp.]|nr:TauD/TfdA family dioxygenase [Trebonia sp.]